MGYRVVKNQFTFKGLIFYEIMDLAGKNYANGLLLYPGYLNQSHVCKKYSHKY